LHIFPWPESCFPETTFATHFTATKPQKHHLLQPIFQENP
jgi:hypothetical protein